MKLTAIGRLTLPIIAIAFGGCTGDRVEEAHGISFGGCKTVLAGPVCVTAKGEPLSIWVPGNTPASFSSSRQRLTAAEAIKVHDGIRYQLTPPAGASELALTLNDNGSKRQWQLALKAADDPTWLTEANSHYRAGNPAKARELVAPIIEAPETSRHAAAFGVLGRMQLRASETSAAMASLRRGMELNIADGRLFDGLSDGLALVYTLIHSDKQFAAATRILDSFGDGNGHAEWDHWLAYHRGDAASEAGDARGALRAFTEAANIAERFGWQRFELNAEQLIAVQLQQLGLRDEARAILQRWSQDPPTDAPDCERGLFYTNVGWNELLVLEAREPADDPLPALQRALKLVSADCGPAEIANAHVNLALAYVHADQPGLAEHHLSLAREITNEPPLRLALWAIDIEARIAAMRGEHDDSMAAYERLERLAAATLSPTARWRAAVGKATLARDSGNLTAAAAAFAQADAALIDDLTQVPITAGRETLTATRQWVTRLHLDTLLEAGESTGAYTLARRTRQRLLTGLNTPATTSVHLADYEQLRAQLSSETRSRWTVPNDELVRIEALARQRRDELNALLDDALAKNVISDAPLSRPSRGTVFVVLHPLTQGWAVFSDDGENITLTRPLCETDSSNLSADCLLAGISAQLVKAKTVIFFPAGQANDIDFHAATVEGKPLLTHAAVAYSADLQMAPGKTERTALLVADPRGDLPGARVETNNIATMLQRHDWQAETLTGHSAESSTVRERLANVGLFHFAGHASFSGQRGWDSELHLANQTIMTIADILALAKPPTLVVLSGCETATVVTERLPDSIGLANAFVAAGSNIVLAAARPVPDTLTTALMSAFYSRWLDGASAAEALREAQLTIRKNHPDADWAAFRLVLRFAVQGK